MWATAGERRTTSQEDGAIGGLHLIVWPLAFLPAFIHLVSLSLSLSTPPPSLLPSFLCSTMPVCHCHYKNIEGCIAERHAFVCYRNSQVSASQWDYERVPKGTFRKPKIVAKFSWMVKGCKIGERCWGESQGAGEAKGPESS